MGLKPLHFAGKLIIRITLWDVPEMKRTACLFVALACLSSWSAHAESETPPPPAASSGTVQPPTATSKETAQPSHDEKQVPDPAAAPAPVGAVQQPDPKEEEVVCKRVESASGSRIGTKQVCLTAREWRDYKEPE